MSSLTNLLSFILLFLHAPFVQSLVTATTTTTSTITSHTSSSVSSSSSQCTPAQGYTNGLSVSDFGSCPNATITYSFNPSTNQITYYPVNNTFFNLLPSTDLAFIESSVCNYLGSSSCNADLATIDLCWAAFWLYSGLVGGYGVGVWNEVMGLPGSSTSCSGSYTPEVSTKTDITSTKYTTVVVVSTYVRSTRSSIATTTITESVTSISTKTRTYSTSIVTIETLTQPLIQTTRLTTITLPVPLAEATSTTVSMSSHATGTVATSLGVGDGDPFSVDGAPFVQNAGMRNEFPIGLLSLCLLATIVDLMHV